MIWLVAYIGIIWLANWLIVTFGPVSRARTASGGRSNGEMGCLT